MEQFARPRSKKDVRSFIGLAGYYRQFIQGFAELALPLTKATTKEQPEKVVWPKELQTSFHSLKMSLICGSVLKGPDFDQPFLLFTDASDLGIGAVLSQQSADGSDHPVAYFSKQLLSRQTRYAVVEKECLAVVKAIQHFKIYLTGVRFRIYTDLAYLRFIHEIEDANGRWQGGPSFCSNMILRSSIALGQHTVMLMDSPDRTGMALPHRLLEGDRELWRYRLNRRTLLKL